MKNKIETSFNYAIHFENSIEALDEFISNGNYSKIVILGDSNTIEHCLPFINLNSTYSNKADIIEIDAGEDNKNIDICIGIWSMMNDFEMDRSSLLINLGGGMVSDMGGFAASTYLRGIDFINIPSSLLAMVDASIGGKNGIDMNSLKNRIGTFTFPKAVFIIPELLQTLPKREFKSAFAEIIKHGLIADENHFQESIEYLILEDDEKLLNLIFNSIEIKNNIVAQDPFDKGIRKSLNFGHTIGHAIESYFLQMEKPVLHGEAILLGIILENKLATQLGILDEKLAQKIEAIIQSNFQLIKLQREAIVTILTFLQVDKKNKAGQINCCLISEIGKVNIDVVVPIETISDLLTEYIS